MKLDELKTVQKSIHRSAWKAWDEYLGHPSDEKLINVLNLIIDVEYCGHLMSLLCEQAGDHIKFVLQKHHDELNALTRILMKIALKELHD
jgi:uncharacterized protein involved in cysteine biosynthesis